MSVSTSFLANAQKVKSFYKKVLRNLESWYDGRKIYRYYADMKLRFDPNKNFTKIMTSDNLLTKEDTLFSRQHWHLRKFWNSIDGTVNQSEIMSFNSSSITGVFCTTHRCKKTTISQYQPVKKYLCNDRCR